MLSLVEFIKNKYIHNKDNKYNPIIRTQDIIDVIYCIKRDGLKVEVKNNKMYIENTVSGEKTLIDFYESGKIKWGII